MRHVCPGRPMRVRGGRLCEEQYALNAKILCTISESYHLKRRKRGRRNEGHPSTHFVLCAEGDEVHLADTLAVVGGGEQQDVIAPHEGTDILETQSGAVAMCLWQSLCL